MALRRPVCGNARLSFCWTRIEKRIEQRLGDRFKASGIVNISGGTIGSEFDANGTVNISGGFIGNGFDATGARSLFISGGEFRLDGALPGSRPFHPCRLIERQSL